MKYYVKSLIDKAIELDLKNHIIDSYYENLDSGELPKTLTEIYEMIYEEITDKFSISDEIRCDQISDTNDTYLE